MPASSAKHGGKTGEEFREIADLLRKHGAMTAEESKTEGKEISLNHSLTETV